MLLALKKASQKLFDCSDGLVMCMLDMKERPRHMFVKKHIKTSGQVPRYTCDQVLIRFTLLKLYNIFYNFHTINDTIPQKVINSFNSTTFNNQEWSFQQDSRINLDRPILGW